MTGGRTHGGGHGGKRDANSPTAPVRVRARERDLEALRLRARGLTFVEIGRQLGIAKQTAHDAVRRGLALRVEEIRERADELRAAECAKLDAAAEAIWPLVEAGDLRAQGVWIKNRARFSDLLGLDLKPGSHEDAGPGIVVIDARPHWDRGDVIETTSAAVALIGDGS